jgi:hypothetical protein
MPSLRPVLAACALLASLAAAPAYALHWGPPEYAGMLSDPALDEVSGMAASHTQPGRYWINNDGGNGDVLQLIELDGTRVAAATIAGANNVDWEDVASFVLGGKPMLLIADTGDNGGIRKTVKLLVVEEPARVRDGDVLPIAWTIEFAWPDGARDCEAAAVDPVRGEVLLVSKKRVPPELFRLPLRPASPGLQVAQPIGTLSGITQPREEELRQNPVYGRYRSQVTGADLSPNGRVLAVLNYSRVYFFTRPDGRAWSQRLLERAGVLDFPWLPQAEAIAFSVDGSSLVIGGEQRPSPLLRFRIRTRDLRPATRRSAEPADPEALAK